MNRAFNLVDLDDDGPTLVMGRGAGNTLVMDRRQLMPSSSVMPVARPVPARPAPPPPAVDVAPSPSVDATQPALRVRRDLAGTRRLAVGLAIGFAFAFGIAVAFGAQVAFAGSNSSSARSPRTVTNRSSTLETRSKPDVLPHATDEASPTKRTSPTTKSVVEPTTNSDALERRDLLGEGLAN
jgi:hypothetical protein